MNDAEDRCVRSDTECEGQHRNRSARWRFREMPERESHVLPPLGEPVVDPLPVRLLLGAACDMIEVDAWITEPLQGLGARVGVAHSAPPQLLCPQLNVQT